MGRRNGRGCFMLDQKNLELCRDFAQGMGTASFAASRKRVFFLIKSGSKDIVDSPALA